MLVLCTDHGSSIIVNWHVLCCHIAVCILLAYTFNLPAGDGVGKVTVPVDDVVGG